jgi:pimeloyl-ACP methyl ester carboxylesterase
VKPAVLLLHGHYLGGWSWEEVEQRLTAEGWRVASPTLPGCGRGEEAVAARTGLQEHLDYALTEIQSLTQEASPRPLVVVAHSYSGLILQTLLGEPAVAPGLTAALFLDAALGRPGECLLDLLERVVPGVSVALNSQRVNHPPRGFVSPPPLDPPTEPLATCRRYAAESGSAPWGTFTDQLPSTAVAIAQATTTPRAYARCEEFPLTETVWQEVRGEEGWLEEVWPVGHLPMLSHPGGVVGWVRRIVGELASTGVGKTVQ